MAKKSSERRPAFDTLGALEWKDVQRCLQKGNPAIEESSDAIFGCWPESRTADISRLNFVGALCQVLGVMFIECDDDDLSPLSVMLQMPQKDLDAFRDLVDGLNKRIRYRVWNLEKGAESRRRAN